MLNIFYTFLYKFVCSKQSENYLNQIVPYLDKTCVPYFHNVLGRFGFYEKAATMICQTSKNTAGGMTVTLFINFFSSPFSCGFS